MKNLRGFSLIELLVVITVVGILAGGVLFLIDPDKMFGNARNAQRKKDLRDMANALEAYATNHGAYPITGASLWCNTSATGTFACGGNNRLGGLIPAYLQRIPIDPRNLQANLFNATCPATNGYGYLYRSDTGTAYKILAYCTPETNQIDPNDPMKDPVRPTTSWAIFSPGASGY